MPSICLYFQIHQPFRLRRFSYFEIGGAPNYFDETLDKRIMERVAENCYLPANERILKLIDKYKGSFKVAFSLSGTAVEQMKMYAPKALRSFKDLASTGCVEFLGETYYHSLAMLFDLREYREQVRAHSSLIQSEFGQKPSVLRNTELVYGNELAGQVSDLGFEGIVAEGVPDILGWRSPNFLYRAPNSKLRILLRNFKLSDDIAFRFTGGPGHQSLTADSYVEQLRELNGNAELVGLFLDYETFGEHHRRETGIFDFLEVMPKRVLEDNDWSFVAPRDAIRRLHPVSELCVPRMTSWADTERDVSAWCGNKMQQGSLARIYDTAGLCGAKEIYSSGMKEMRETWRKLQTSDHFYYMSTKGSNDGEVHRYFSHFESPYDAFIAYMNVLKDFAQRCQTDEYGVPLKRASSD